jgi:hypothetical protein
MVFMKYNFGTGMFCVAIMLQLFMPVSRCNLPIRFLGEKSERRATWCCRYETKSRCQTLRLLSISMCGQVFVVLYHDVDVFRGVLAGREMFLHQFILPALQAPLFYCAD